MGGRRHSRCPALTPRLRVTDFTAPFSLLNGSYGRVKLERDYREYGLDFSE